MTKKIILLCVAVVAVAFVAMNPLANTDAAVSQTSVAVQVPGAINDAIAVGITALVALGLAYVLKWTGLDLTMYATPLAVTISAWVVAELQNVINTIPESYDPTLDFVLKVIVVLLGSVGFLVWRKRPAPNEPYNPSLLAP